MIHPRGAIASDICKDTFASRVMNAFLFSRSDILLNAFLGWKNAAFLAEEVHAPKTEL
jgi:hypothetical protein